MEDTLKELIEFFKVISPEVWQVLMKQIYVVVNALIVQEGGGQWSD